MLSLVGIARTLAFSLRRWRALKGFEQKGVIPNLHFKKIEGQARGWEVGRGGRGKGKSRRIVRNLLQSPRLEAVVAWFIMVTEEEVRGS